MTEEISTKTLEFFNFYQFDEFMCSAITILKMTKMSLTDTCRMLIFSTKETPYKKDFEEIFGKAIELACQIVPNVRRIFWKNWQSS